MTKLVTSCQLCVHYTPGDAISLRMWTFSHHHASKHHHVCIRINIVYFVIRVVLKNKFKTIHIIKHFQDGVHAPFSPNYYETHYRIEGALGGGGGNSV